MPGRDEAGTPEQGARLIPALIERAEAAGKIALHPDSLEVFTPYAHDPILVHFRHTGLLLADRCHQFEDFRHGHAGKGRHLKVDLDGLFDPWQQHGGTVHVIRVDEHVHASRGLTRPFHLPGVQLSLKAV